MYPAALHKNLTETVDSSQVFKIWILRKQLNIISKHAQSWDKNTFIDLEQVCRKQDHEFLCWLLSSESFSPRLILFSRSNICPLCSVSQFWVSVKILIHNNFVYIDNASHITKFTTSSCALSSYQTVLPRALHSELWSFAWMGNSNKSTFFRQQHYIGNFGTNHDLSNFPPLSPLNCWDSCTFLSLLSNFYLLQFWEECWEALCNPKIHCPTQVRASFSYKKTHALRYCFFGGRTELAWTFR